MNKVASILAENGRNWSRKEPASEAEIAYLKSSVEVQLPAAYIDLLRVSNGGEGELALAPLWFQLFDIAFAIELACDHFYVSEFEGLFFFGSNGGLESVAFDMRCPPPWPVVMVDCIAGVDSAEQIAKDISEFIAAIGLASNEKA